MLLPLLFATLALAAPIALHAQDGPRLEVRAIRYYRPEAPNTRVKAIVQVPVSAFGAAPGGRVTYTVGVTVRDSSGLTNYQESWRSHAAYASSADAWAIEMLEVALQPGAYRLQIDVQDSVTGTTLTRTVPMEAFSGNPGASDLLLASAMRTVSAEDSVPNPGELRRGNTIMTASALLSLTALRSRAYYLLEVYSRSPGEQVGQMSVAVLDQSGRQLLQTSPSPVKVGEGGGVLRGQLDLEGLPPGDYSMKVSVTLPDAKQERSAPLRMADLQAALARDTMRIAAARQTDEGFFEYMPAEKLDSAFAPLQYIATSAEMKLWNKGRLPEAAKRRFLTKFWTDRDPTPGTPENERRLAFYRAIDQANSAYSERGVPGWRTDRGRIFIKFGAPDQVLSRPNEAQSPPYEVWRYTAGRQRWFVFADMNRGNGNYRLMATNELRETGRPDWRSVLTEDGVRDVGRFVGQDFYGSSDQPR